jgi:hypothetical protein
LQCGPCCQRACFLCQGLNVQSSKPSRSFSKNCHELTGKPSKIKFFWSFQSGKFKFCNQFRVQQNIFERTFLEPSSHFSSFASPSSLTSGTQCMQHSATSYQPGWKSHLTTQNCVITSNRVSTPTPGEVDPSSHQWRRSNL